MEINMLFSEYDRTYQGPATYAEPDYEYLDKSARKDAECIRSVISKWFNNYPESDKKDLLARFKSPDDLQHYSASFELYLHELLIKMGYEVTVHPETTSTKNTRPDFLATDNNGNCFYLEAVLSIEESKESTGANKRIQVVYDTINKLASNDYFISVKYTGIPKSPPRGSALRSRLNKWLLSLNADDIIKSLSELGHESLPTQCPSGKHV